MSARCYYCSQSAPTPAPLQPARCEADDCPSRGGREARPRAAPPAPFWTTVPTWQGLP